MEERIALIGIIVEDAAQAPRINELLHNFSDYILGRMGVPYRAKKLCVISVVLDAPNDVISALTGKLGQIPGARCKAMYTKG
jgi:putative iron-only hydrogenase system regulator